MISRRYCRVISRLRSGLANRIDFALWLKLLMVIIHLADLGALPTTAIRLGDKPNRST